MADRRRVLIDGETFAEDVAHVSQAGRAVAHVARAWLERDGVELSSARACQPEGRDGTRLPGCVKLYLPQPAGPWGMVFADWRTGRGEPVLVFLAFGRRHPLAPWQPSVYQVADRRLHARLPAGE